MHVKEPAVQEPASVQSETLSPKKRRKNKYPVCPVENAEKSPAPLNTGPGFSLPGKERAKAGRAMRLTALQRFL